MSLKLEDRPCKACKQFKPMLDGSSICRKKLMGVVPDMLVTFKVEDGTCFESLFQDGPYPDELNRYLVEGSRQAATEMHWIGARSQSEAEQIASKCGLSRSEWRRAHGGKPSHLLDGINVSDRKYLLGEFTTGEWLVLTAHLPGVTGNG